MLDESHHRPALVGAAAALALGLGAGVALKAEIAPESSYGQQLMLGERRARAPGAFEAWYPSEGPPPPWMEVADLRAADTDALDAAIERLLAWRPEETAPRPVRAVRAQTEPVEIAALPAEPQPYAPEPADPPFYEPPPAEAPAWGWALPDGGYHPAGPDAYAPPPYPGAAAG